MGAMRVVVAAARVAAGKVVVGALVPILVPVVGLVQVAAVLLLLLLEVGAALLLALGAAVGAALLGRGSAAAAAGGQTCNTTCHDIPLGGSGSSVTPAISLPLGSTFSQSDSGVIPIPIPFRCLNGS
ncbi:hypothetical protein EMCRGX_G008411 [Ephydatia muelleri]